MVKRVGERIKIYNADRDHTYKAETELWLLLMTRTNPGMSRRLAYFLLPIGAIIINGRGMPFPSTPRDVSLLKGYYDIMATEEEKKILEEVTKIYFDYLISEEDFEEIETERTEKDFIFYCETLKTILGRVRRK